MNKIRLKIVAVLIYIPHEFCEITWSRLRVYGFAVNSICWHFHLKKQKIAQSYEIPLLLIIYKENDSKFPERTTDDILLRFEDSLSMRTHFVC